MSQIKDKLITAEGLKLVHDTLDEKIASASGGSEYFGVCDTLASTSTKTVTVDSSFELKDGVVVKVLFMYPSGSSSPKLSVNNTTAKYIKLSRNVYAGGDPGTDWRNGEVITLVYYQTLDAWLVCSPSYMYSPYNPFMDGYYITRPAALFDTNGVGVENEKADTICLAFNVGAPIVGPINSISFYGTICTYDGKYVYGCYGDGSGTYPLIEYDFGDYIYGCDTSYTKRGDVELSFCVNDIGDYLCTPDGTPLSRYSTVFVIGSIYIYFGGE